MIRIKFHKNLRVTVVDSYNPLFIPYKHQTTRCPFSNAQLLFFKCLEFHHLLRLAGKSKTLGMISVSTGGNREQENLERVMMYNFDEGNDNAKRIWKG